MPKITFLDESAEITQEEWNKIKESLTTKEERFVPEEDETYFSVCNYGDEINIYEFDWANTSADHYRLNTGNCFRTEKEAIKHRDKLLAIAEVTRYCYEKDYVLDCDWEDTRQNKYFIGYNHDIKMPYTGVWVYTELAIVLPYLKSKEACQDVIEVKKAELSSIFEIE